MAHSQDGEELAILSSLILHSRPSQSLAGRGILARFFSMKSNWRRIFSNGGSRSKKTGNEGLHGEGFSWRVTSGFTNMNQRDSNKNNNNNSNEVEENGESDTSDEGGEGGREGGEEAENKVVADEEEESSESKVTEGVESGLIGGVESGSIGGVESGVTGGVESGVMGGVEADENGRQEYAVKGAGDHAAGLRGQSRSQEEASESGSSTSDEEEEVETGRSGNQRAAKKKREGKEKDKDEAEEEDEESSSISDTSTNLDSVKREKGMDQEETNQGLTTDQLRNVFARITDIMNQQANIAASTMTTTILRDLIKQEKQDKKQGTVVKQEEQGAIGGVMGSEGGLQKILEAFKEIVEKQQQIISNSEINNLVKTAAGIMKVEHTSEGAGLEGAGLEEGIKEGKRGKDSKQEGLTNSSGMNYDRPGQHISDLGIYNGGESNNTDVGEHEFDEADLQRITARVQQIIERREGDRHENDVDDLISEEGLQTLAIKVRDIMWEMRKRGDVAKSSSELDSLGLGEGDLRKVVDKVRDILEKMGDNVGKDGPATIPGDEAKVGIEHASNTRVFRTQKQQLVTSNTNKDGGLNKKDHEVKVNNNTLTVNQTTRNTKQLKQNNKYVNLQLSLGYNIQMHTHLYIYIYNN